MRRETQLQSRSEARTVDPHNDRFRERGDTPDHLLAVAREALGLLLRRERDELADIGSSNERIGLT